ncbi:hypothetical protein niasHT_010381 [Heterodera trifolii]|uniref:Uncharacterized protein n=1 Tax=Heterodera trifolii TaxID=157864 RepID=A0ABD2MBI3_9BILA
MSTEEGYRIYEHWTTQAFASILSLFLQDMLVFASQQRPIRHDAGPIQRMLFWRTNSATDGQMHRSAVEQRFQIGLTNANIIDGTKNMAKSEKWVGEIRKSGERGSSGGEASRAKATEAGRLVDILSPRFMSLTASKSSRKANFLSPSLLSLHTKGHGIERKMILPNLMKEGAHLLDKDQNEWLNLIMEASGVNDQVDTVKHLLSSADDGHDGTDEEMAKKVEKRYKREFNGLYLTKENVREMYGQNEQRKSDIWEKLVQTLSKEQLTAMNRSGIVSMNAEQLRLIYGPSSPFNDSATLRRLLTIVKNGTSVSKICLR